MIYLNTIHASCKKSNSELAEKSVKIPPPQKSVKVE